MTQAPVEIVDVAEQSRYEARLDGDVVGFAAYQKTGQLVVFTHTEVDDAMEGRGIGSALVRGALDDVRRQALPVLPVCPFVQSWMTRHPDYADLDYRGPASRVSD
jgi:predicted GNAT family acetyltransferase